MPKCRFLLAFAQVRALAATVCKIADDSLPRFESWTCHPFARVRPVRRPGPADVGERCLHRRRSLRRPATRPAATSKAPVTSQDARTPRQACRCQKAEAAKIRKLCQICAQEFSRLRLRWGGAGKRDGPWVPGRLSSSYECAGRIG